MEVTSRFEVLLSYHRWILLKIWGNREGRKWTRINTSRAEKKKKGAISK
jgi:hypothetical protein